MRVLELGAGTGALGIALACSLPNIHVTLTDLAPVVPLMRENADATRDAGKLADGSETHVAELAWSRDAVLALNGGGGASSGGGGGTEGSTHGGRDASASRERWDVVLGCEILYWGGWDVFADDTRGPLLEACIAACERGGCRGCRHSCVVPPTLVVLAFTVRDQGRESGFVSKDFGEKFWLRLLDGGANVCVCGDEDEETLARMDADARARTDAAEEGDLLVLGAVGQMFEVDTAARRRNQFLTSRVRYPPSHGNLQSTALLASRAHTTVLAYSLSTALLAVSAPTTVLTYSLSTALLAVIALTTVLADCTPTAFLALRAPTTVLAD
jgi:hypothetical protein